MERKINGEPHTQVDVRNESKSSKEGSLEVGKYKFEIKILKPECITPDFPNGFGLEINLTEADNNPAQINFEDFIREQKQWVIEMVRTYGTLVLHGMSIEKVTDRNLSFQTLPIDHQSFISWHYDQNFTPETDGNMVALVLGQKESQKPRPVPTHVSPTSLVAKHIRQEIQREQQVGIEDTKLSSYYNEIVNLPDQELLDSISQGFNNLRHEFSGRREAMVRLLTKTTEEHKDSIIAHNYSENKGSVLIIDTEEVKDSSGAKNCKVSHARIFDRKGKEREKDPDNPVYGYYYLERAFIFDK